MQDKEMWEVNISNSASKVASEYGQAVVDSVFSRYDSHGLYDLPACYLDEVFADLEQIIND